jgi:hypothetical protein
MRKRRRVRTRLRRSRRRAGGGTELSVGCAEKLGDEKAASPHSIGAPGKANAYRLRPRRSAALRIVKTTRRRWPRTATSSELDGPRDRGRGARAARARCNPPVRNSSQRRHGDVHRV